MVPDIIFASVTLILVMVTGFSFARARNNLMERFVAGRQLSWLALGASMAATSTSADTPLLIAGLVYADGLAGNWYWWAGAPGVLATLFFFARLWRRAGVVTEVEVITLRYGQGEIARRYRMLNGLFEGLLVNGLVLASNAFAFGLILNALLNRWQISHQPALAGALVGLCLFLTAGYALFVGFRGLVKSDAVEFLIAVSVGTLLAVIAIRGLPHGLSDLARQHTEHGQDSVFTLWPTRDSFAPVLMLLCSWWYNAPGKGMMVQRIAASRDEHSAILTVLTFAGLHYLVRPWAWYLIGAAGLIYLPHLAQPETVLPAMGARLLAPGLFGLLVAAMALSFMASANSRLNFGASLIVNDVALVLRPEASTKMLRMVERVTIATLCVGCLATALLGAGPGIRGLYQFLTMMLAGTGFVAIARWYWSRTTIWSEICSLASALIVACMTLFWTDIARPIDYALALGANFVIGAVMTLVTALLGPKADGDAVETFRRRVRPGGPGWSRSATGAISRSALAWLLANTTLFAAMFAIARLLAGSINQAAMLLALATISLVLLLRGIRTTRLTSAA
ncbi:hypothetical protein RN629_11825 [Sphingomonadaceae bacterium jetA1]|jgi:Na+/proline symporter|uniref:sodium:solute symporter family transporter n=1 Tax=Facivitalis istanbulensis TaxID=3075838 RepID=UPI00346D7753